MSAFTVNEHERTASPVPQPLPLTPLQQTMLFGGEHHAGQGTYILQVVTRLEHTLDVEKLFHAWEQALAQRPSFSACFTFSSAGEAEQRFNVSTGTRVHRLDWSQLPHDTLQDRLEKFLVEDRAREFSLQHPPLHRLTHIQGGKHLHWCVFTLHHALADGHALADLHRTVFQIYDGVHTEPPVDSTWNYAALLKSRLSHDKTRLKKHWTTYLNGCEHGTTLPFISGASSSLGPPYKIIKRPLNNVLLKDLAQLARTAEVRLSTVLHGALGVLLSRWLRSDEILVQVVKSLRHLVADQVSLEEGLLINSLLLRLKISPEASLQDWLREVRTSYQTIRDGELASPAEVAEWCSDAGITAWSEIDFLFEWKTFQELITSREGCWENRYFELRERTPVPLSLAVYGGETPQVHLEFETARVPDAMAERFLDSFTHLLEQFAQHPNAALSTFESAPSRERERMLHEWQRLDLLGPQSTLPLLFEAAVARQPDATAVQENERVVSYAELNMLANNVAQKLQAHDLTGAAVVAILVPRSVEMIAAALGVMKAGAAYLPLDVSLPMERLDFVLKDAGAGAVLTTARQTDKLPATLPHILVEDAVMGDGSWAGGAPAPEDIAYIIYTSGSTGTPKGVALPHGAVTSFIQSAIDGYGFQPTDRILQFAALSFDASVEEIFGTLSSGAALVLRNEEMLVSAELFFQQCEHWQVSVLPLPTAYWHFLADAVAEVAIPASLRTVIIGGEAMMPDKWRKWRQTVPAAVSVLNGYGPTETAVCATLWNASAAGDSGAVSIGRPFPTVEALVLDQHLRLVPPGVPGELCIGGPQLAAGYLNRPELTASAFPPNPYRPGDRIYRTGDLVRWEEDGQLYYMGRIDHQVKVRGFRIELGEIETVLTNHPQIAAAAVITATDASGNEQLVAFAESRNGALDAEALKLWLAQQLPPYMVPAQILLVDKLQKTSSGKIDRQVLKGLSRSCAGQQTPEQPVNQLEHDLAEIWARVLHLRHVRPEDNFFHLGGHSLLSFVMLTQVEKKFGRRIPPYMLYQAQTLRDFAGLLTRSDLAPPPQIVHTIQKGSRPQPVFFVGSTDLLPALLPTMGQEWTICSLNLFGMLPMEGPLPDLTVASVATRFIEEITQIQPSGPYFLGGYCRDAMVALEMAHQLCAKGEKVAFLGMIDMFWGAPERRHFMFRHLHNLKEFGWSYVRMKLKNRKRLLHNKKQRLKTQLALRQNQGVEAPLPSDLRNAHFVNTFYDHCDTYKLHPFPGKITLILASEWCLQDAPELRNLAQEGVDVLEVRAFHQNLWTGEQALELGRVIREQLEKAAE